MVSSLCQCCLAFLLSSCCHLGPGRGSFWWIPLVLEMDHTRAAVRTRAGARVFPQQNNLRSTAQVLNV
jgi:hypothetical protein